jgi:hypothetical protein
LLGSHPADCPRRKLNSRYRFDSGSRPTRGFSGVQLGAVLSLAAYFMLSRVGEFA